MHSHVEAIRTCNLILSSGFILKLEKTFYIPSLSRNLILVSRLVSFGYSYNFSNTSFNLFYKYDIVRIGTLSYGLFSFNLQNDVTYNAMHVQVGIE